MPSFKSTSGHSSSSGPKSVGLESHLFKSHASEKETSPEPPTAPGGYLEPSYHFISRVKPTVLLQAIVSVMQNNGIDFQLNSKKYKVKCALYPIGEPKVPFVASVFQMDSDKMGKRYAVEFQRRSTFGRQPDGILLRKGCLIKQKTKKSQRR